MIAFIIPDLALVICDPDIPPFDQSFREQFEDVFLGVHDVRIRDLHQRLGVLQNHRIEHTIKWAFSDDLNTYIFNSFPYNRFNEPGFEWVADLLKVFHQSMPSPDVLIHTNRHKDVHINPDIPPNHTNDRVRQAWLDLIATCIQADNADASMASYPREQSIHHIMILFDEREQQMRVISQKADWDELQREIDPWFRNNLPVEGEYPYRPPARLHPRQPFPSSSKGKQPNFIDEDGRRWEWDRTENHWDVQFPHSEAYQRITPDGRLLG